MAAEPRTPLIRSGCVEEAHPESGEWAFVDLGFAGDGKKTCCLLVAGGDPRLYTFAGLIAVLKSMLAEEDRPLNLVLEAPLSVAFSQQGNPVGRVIEKRGGQTRYWYVGLGCSVLTSAMYLFRELAESPPAREVRLFEGFVSFKPKNMASDHSADVQCLQDVIWRVPGAGYLASSASLSINSEHVLKSAFAVCGLDYGVPPVVVADGGDRVRPRQKA